MTQVTVKLDGAAIQKLLAGPDGPVAVDLLRRATRVQARARQLAPKRTGKLSRSIVKRGPYREGRGIYVAVISNLDYALFQHEGTRPHVIRARRKRLLAFEWPKMGPGVFMFPKVNHPGTKPVPFLKDALEAARG